MTVSAPEQRSFGDFVRAKSVQFGVPLGLTAMIGSFNYIRQVSSWTFEHGDPRLLSILLYGAISLILVFLLALLMQPIPALPRVQDEQTEQIQRARRAVAQFLHQWKLLWTIWVVFYLVLGFQRFMIVQGSSMATAPAASLIIHALNNAQTAALYLCYYVITWTSLKWIGERAAYEEQTPANMVWILWLIVTLIDAGSAYALNGTARLTHLQEAFKIVSGFGCGVAMAMVVGRLESKYAGSHPFLVFLFYLYALLQMTFLVFGGEAVKDRQLTLIAYEQDAVAAFALILKVVLFAFVYWLIHSNRLLYYMVKIHDLNNRVEPEWEEFRQKLDPAK